MHLVPSSLPALESSYPPVLEPEARADLEDGGDDRVGDEGDEREGGGQDGGGDGLRDVGLRRRS